MHVTVDPRSCLLSLFDAHAGTEPRVQQSGSRTDASGHAADQPSAGCDPLLGCRTGDACCPCANLASRVDASTQVRGPMSVRPIRRGPLQVRIELAVAAFTPVFLLIALRSGGAWWAWVFFVLTAAGVLVLVVGAVLVLTGGTEEFDLVEIHDASDQVVGYIAAYIVPVVIDPSASPLNAVISAAALLLAFIIHVATGTVHINPLLYLLGYRIYVASTATASYALIAHSEVADWEGDCSLVDLSSGVLVERPGRK